MKNYFLLLVGIMMTLSLSAQNFRYDMSNKKQGRGNSKVEYQGKSIDRMIYEFMEEQKIPGMTLAIVQAPYIPRVVGYGVTDLKFGKLAAARTIWPIGPISQGYTAVAIMQLKERGRLKLDDKISKYVRRLPDEWRDITILELMQHSSGIADYRDVENYDISKYYSPEELIESVKNTALSFVHGTDVKQSATNFLLLSMVVEKAGRMSYHKFIRKYQIDYLGLKQTYMGENLDEVMQEDITKTGNKHKLFTKENKYISPAETTIGYVEKDGMLEQAKELNPRTQRGFSDIWASAENVSQWDIALAGGILIKDAKDRDVIYKPTTLTNGKVVPAMAGWQFYNHKGLMDIKGTSPGHSAFLSRFTDASELVCVTLLANKDGVDLTNLARKIAGAFDPKLGSPSNDNALFTYESQFSVDKTIDRINSELKSMNIPVFATFDHSRNASEVGLNLRPTKVIVFGSPKVGTILMQKNQSLAIELPLKISVWEDKDGSVWVNFPLMKEVGKRFSLEDEPIINAMNNLLSKIVKKSSSIY